MKLAPGDIVHFTLDQRVALARRIEYQTYIPDVADCWEWVGSTSGSGYGKLRLLGDLVGAHRLSYALLAAPDGAVMPDIVHHTCANKICVCPSHLEPVTQSRNIKYAYGNTLGDYRCRNGHENPRLYTAGQRHPKCALCHIARTTESYRRRKTKRQQLGKIRLSM